VEKGKRDAFRRRRGSRYDVLVKDDDVDLPTVLSIAVVAYCLTNLVHEGLGHGGACLLAGGKPLELNAIFFQSESDAISDNGRRLLVAGGSVANLIFAAMAWLGLRVRRRADAFGYFLTLMLALNLLMPFGYLMFSGVGGFGDWAVFIDGLGPPLVLRALLAVAGAFLYFWIAPMILCPAFNPYLGRDLAERARRRKPLALYPYLTGGAVYVVAGLFNSQGWKLVLLSAAAASLGGTSFLAWFPGRADKEWAERAPEQPASLPRSIAWIAAGVVTAAIFIGVFGPGLKL
jgi:hypothetical protein